MLSPCYTFSYFNTKLNFTKTLREYSSNCFFINIDENNNSIHQRDYSFFTKNEHDTMISKLEDVETLTIRVNHSISNELFDLLEDVFAHLHSLRNLQIFTNKHDHFSEYNDFFTLFPKSIETLSLQTILPDNILNVIASHYINLKFVDIQKSFTVCIDVFFNNLYKLRFYEVQNPLSKEEHEKIHGVEIVDMEMEFFTQRYLQITEVMLNLIMKPLCTDYIIGIETDHCDEITCFPNTTRIENVLLDVDFIKAYEMYKSFRYEELMDTFRILNETDKEFKIFMSYIMFHLMYITKLNVKVFDNSKYYGRINPLYHTIQMNMNVHTKIKESMCLLDYGPPE